jgi:excisionase family DNA binding protein
MADLTEFELLDVPDVMRVLRVSRTMVYDLLRSGKLPGIRIGATWRIPVTDLRRYLEASRMTSAPKTR